ncbi:MAG TPA: MMPL family transporter, partial [bacterium]
MLKEKTLVQYLKKYYWVVILLAIAATVAGSFWSFKLRLESDLATLLPSDYESVKTIERIKEVVGGQGNIRIVIESPNFEKLKLFADTLAARFEASPEINFVDYKNGVAFYKRNALLFLEKDELDSLQAALEDKIDYEKQKLNPFYVEDLFGDDSDAKDVDLAKWEEKYRGKEPKEYYLNADSTVLVMDVFPAGATTSLSDVKAMFEKTRRMVEETAPQSYDPQLQVYLGGNIKNRLDEYEVVRKDILGTGYYGLTGVFLLILIYFRRIMAAVLITIALAMSISWTFGITYLAIGSLNTITGFLFIILFGLGIDYGIHSLSRYSESRRAGASMDEALAVWVGPTRRALATSAFTTMAAFLSLLLMDFKGFSELGFISGTGIAFAFVAMILLLPSLVVLSEKWHLLKFKPSPAKAAAKNHPPRPFPFSKIIVYAAMLMALYSIYALTQLEFEYDFSNLRAELPERQTVGQKTKGIFELSESPAIVLGNSKEEVDEIVAAVKTIIKTDTLSPTVEAVRSAYSFVAEDQTEKLKLIAEIRRLVEEETEGILKGKDKER